MKQYEVQPLDLMQWINTKYHEPFIHELLEFDERPNPERLIRAVEALAEAFPLLKCRYEENSNRFIENEAFSVHDLVRIDEEADRDTLLTESLNTDKSLVLFTLSKNMLVITISHMVCDGGGFKQLLYLLCGLYNGKTVDAHSGQLMERSFAQLTKRISGTAGITVKMLVSMLGNYKSRPVYKKTDHEDVYVIERTISRAVMARVHERAKQQGATLNDVFLTAYADALAKRYGLKKLHIPCTVDLRKYAEGDTGIANLTGTYDFNIKKRDGADFAEMLKEASAVMKKQKRTKNDLAGPLLLVSKYEKSTLADFLKLYGGMSTSASADYTNIGVLDDKALAFDGAKLTNAVGYSVLNKAPFFQIAVSTFRGEATVSTLVRCGKEEKEKAERILDGMVREIELFSR